MKQSWKEVLEDRRLRPKLISYFEKQGWLQQQDGISKFMTMQDKDGDGFISWDEFTGPKSKKAPARQPPKPAAAAEPPPPPLRPR